MSKRAAKSRQKRKSAGLYYTPKFIVDYIVQQTVKKKIARKKPKSVANFKVADPACGAGVFLLGTFEEIMEHHAKYYNKPSRRKEALASGCVENPDGTLRLSFEQKKQILVNNIYGVDINPKAVELCKLVLWLRLIVGEEGVDVPREYAWEIAQKADAFIAGEADEHFTQVLHDSLSAIYMFIGFDEKGNLGNLTNIGQGDIDSLADL